MRNRRRWIFCHGAIAAATIGLRPVLARNSQADDPVRDTRLLLDRQAADWNRGDLDGFLAGYWNSPKVVFQSGGHRSDGWQAMRDRYRRRYQAEGRAMGQLTFSAVEIEPLGPDVVLARGQWRLRLPDGGRPGGLFTLIIRKFPEGWKIVHDHTSAEDPAPPPAPAPLRPNRAVSERDQAAPARRVSAPGFQTVFIDCIRRPGRSWAS